MSKIIDKIKVQERVTQVVAAVQIGLLQKRRREVKYLQPYYKQGNRWYKLKAVK